MNKIANLNGSLKAVDPILPLNRGVSIGTNERELIEASHSWHHLQPRSAARAQMMLLGPQINYIMPSKSHVIVLFSARPQLFKSWIAQSTVSSLCFKARPSAKP